MLTALYILGSIGGIIVLIEEVVQFVKSIRLRSKNFAKYKRYYDEHHDDDDETKPTMGFKTNKEQKEIEAKMAKKG